MKKKWSADKCFMLIMGMLMQAVFLFPWIQISGKKYQALSYLLHIVSAKDKAAMFQEELCSFPMLEGLPWEELKPIAIVFVVQLILLLLAQICCLVHTVRILMDRSNRQGLYYFAGIITTCSAFLYSQGPILATGNLITEGYTFIVMLMIGIEIIGHCMIDSWGDIVRENEETKQKEEAAKQEKKERTKFEGKYSPLFSNIIRKNFRYYWRSYRIFVFVGTFSVCLIFAGFGMWESLKESHVHENLLMGQGLGSILIGFLAVVLVVSVFLMISVLLFYLKHHVRNYGMFVTLGMRKRTLYSFMGIELVSCMLLSLILGTVCGNVLLYLCRKYLFASQELHLVQGHVTYRTFGLTVLCALVIFLLSVLLTREVYIDTGASVSGNKAVEREKMPGKWMMRCWIPGAILCIYGIFRFASLQAFEGMKTLGVFFVGLYLLLNSALAWYLQRRKKNDRVYYGRLLQNNPFYYRYRTTFRYLFFFTVIHVSVLFVFARGMISSMIADPATEQFPYDYVCMATEEDEEIFEEIAGEYGAEITYFPMVRVINVDNTTTSDNYMSAMFPQGQQIGISESTYRELCKIRGWDSETLDLAEDGSEVAVIYQQDQSVNAHPLDYYMGAKPYLHIGQPIQYYEFVDREEIFPPRKVVASKTGSLIGSFRQGRHENIVVFSDAYFESVKDDWEKTDCNTGMTLEGDSVQDVTVHHWPTMLVLMNIPEEKQSQVEEKLELFNRNHEYDDHIDSSVLSCYSRSELIRERGTEQFMNIAVNGFILVILSLVSLVLMYLKMESELDEKRRQYVFLKCMGMNRKERIRLLKKEQRDMLVIPLVLGCILSAVFTGIIWKLREYSAADCTGYLKIWSCVCLFYLLIQILGTGCMGWYYRKKIEERA